MRIHESLKTKSALKFIVHFAKKQKLTFFIQVILCFVWSIKESLFPFFIKLVLDNIYTHGKTWPTLFYPFYALVFVWVLMEVAMRIQGVLSIRTFPKFRANIRKYCFEYFQAQHYIKFSNTPIGEYTDQITHLPLSCQTVLEIFLLHFVSIFSAIMISFALLIQVNIFFPLLLLGWLCCHLLLTYFMNPKISSFGMAHADAVTKLSGNISDIFHNFLPVKWFNRENYELEKFDADQKNELNKASSAQLIIEKMRLFQSVFAVIYMLLMISGITFYWRHQLISLGDLTLIPMLSFSVLGMIWWLTQELNILYRELNRIRSILNFMSSKKPDISPKKTIISDVKKKLSVRCEHLSFQYEGNKIFNSVNLNIEPGSCVGITGFSGSGKSTFLKLLTGILPCQEGSIFLNTNNISNLEPMTLSRLIAVVPQEPRLFNRTIFENIQYGYLSATKNQVIQVAEQALCDEFVQRLPNGYNTLVGDGGVDLSLGQKQRIIIARALLANSPIMILDEPTANLDSITENTLLNILKDILKIKTVIIISHRISTLSIANRIVLFDNGQIVEDGNMQYLLKKKGGLYQIYQQQILDASFS